MTDPRLIDQQMRLRVAVVGDAAAAEAVAAGLLAPRAAGDLLGVYRHAYRARLLAALRENHPRLARVMGDEAFDALGAAYVAAHPPRRASIRWVGDQLAAFAAAQPALAPHPALADLARMEWALRTAFDAADAVPLQAEALRGQPPDAWPGLRFQPLPSAQLLALAWAVEPLWRAAGDVDPAAGDAVLPEPQAHAHQLLVWRPGLETRWRALAPLEATLLAALFAREPFAALCACAAQATGDDAAAAAVVGLLQGWLAEGLLAAVDA